MEFSRQKFWSGFSISFTRGSSNPGIKPTSPAWQDSSPLRQRVNTRPYSFSLFFKRLKSSRGNYNNNNKKQNKTKQNKKHRADIRFLIFRSQWICLLLGIFLFSSNRYPFCRNVIPFQTEINLFFPHFTAINLFVFIINQQEWTLTTICHSLQTIIWVHMLKPDFLDFHPIIVIYQLCDIWEIT